MEEAQGEKIGTHGDNCPHCLGGKCECHCRECRPDLWEELYEENHS